MENDSKSRTRLMPEDLANIFKSIQLEATWLHAKWKIFCQLYAFSEERIQLLDEMGRSFFRIVEDVLRDDIFMSFSRLTDPLRIGRKENLSLVQLIEHLDSSEDAIFYETVSESIKDIVGHYKPFRDIRNRKIAHTDLPTALLDYHKDPLPGISKEMVDDAMKKIRDLLNYIELHYEGAVTGYEHILLLGDGENLVKLLEQAQRQEDLVRRLATEHKHQNGSN